MLKLRNERISAIVTVVVQMFFVINAILTAAGRNPIPFDETAVTETLTYIITIGWSAWAWWRNNNLTKAAVKGQEVTNMEKGKDE